MTRTVSTRFPPVREVAFGGEDQAFQGEIGASFGIDLIDVILDPPADRRPLTLELRATPGSEAEFSLQLVRTMDSAGGARPRHVSAEDGAGEIDVRLQPDGRLSYVVPAARPANRLGLIITRLDAQEASDPVGEYAVVLRPGRGGDVRRSWR